MHVFVACPQSDSVKPLLQVNVAIKVLEDAIVLSPQAGTILRLEVRCPTRRDSGGAGVRRHPLDHPHKDPSAPTHVH